jgi:pimeloyl-ACP methyl ester carboxylesterase
VATYASFDGISLDYRLLGEGPLVVMIHGFASDAQANWVATGIAAVVVDAGFAVALPDARGHGRSAKPHDVDAYRPPAMARDVSALLDHLGATSAHLVGYSLGSTTAITVAAMDDRIGRIVLGGAGGTLLRADTEPLRQRRLLGAAVLEVEDASTLTDPAAIGYRAFVDGSGGDRKALAAAQRAEEGLAPGTLDITNPTLVISGADDTSSGAPEELADLLVHGRAARLAGDHLGAVRDPDFPRQIIEFLRA